MQSLIFKILSTWLVSLATELVVVADSHLEVCRPGVYRLVDAPSLAAYALEAACTLEVYALEEACTLEVWSVGDHADDRHKPACIPSPDKDHGSHCKRS